MLKLTCEVIDCSFKNGLVGIGIDVLSTVKALHQRTPLINGTSRYDGKILASYIVGSEAKGCARADSDLDIAIVIPKKVRLSALQVTEHYHAKFKADNQKPSWNGRQVDLQFFYSGDVALASNKKN